MHRQVTDQDVPHVDTFVAIAFYCMYMCMNFVYTVNFLSSFSQLRLTTVFKE